MLNSIYIRNFAIIDKLELDFLHGMTVLTGETGAGKSIVVDALGIAIGNRADSSLVRHGCKRAEIIASFDISSLPHIAKWLKENELDDENECLLRRTISADGGSRAYINNRPVPLQSVKNIAESLTDIHSQHQHQSLMQPNSQLELLDGYGNHLALTEQVKANASEQKKIQKHIATLISTASEKQTQHDFISFQLAELENLNLANNEWASLEEEHAKLANAEEIERTIHGCLETLQDTPNSVLSNLQHSVRYLSTLANFIPQAKNILATVENANIQLEDAIAEIRALKQTEEIDKNRLEWVETRMAELLSLAKKHQVDPSSLTSIINRLTTEQNQLQHADDAINELNHQLQQKEKIYATLSNQLTAARIKTIKKLSTSVTKIMTTLGMPNSAFQAVLVPTKENTLSIHGNETIRFDIRTNPGLPFKPLNKTASGGELSRISLAIQVITSQVAKIPTLIFDEVDVGIGGATTEVVGDLLKTLSKDRQVICITHQAQVAAQGHQHYFVRKSMKKKTTKTSIDILNEEERIIELARMIGGVKITDTTMNHAKEMYARRLSANGDHQHTL